MRTVFHDELDQITSDLLGIADLVRTACADATTALLQADVQLADKVIAGDRDIDAKRADLDSHAIDLLARQSPVATDLRTIVTSMRMSADLERMGDLARHVAKLARLRYPEHAVPDEVRPTIQQMSEVCARIIDKVEGCLQTQGLEAVDEIDRVDDELDELHRDLYSRLVDGHWTHGTESAVDMALLGRYYERFGDHGVSIGHRVRFLVTGEQPAADLTD